MGKVIAGMTLSLDGFINDNKGGVGILYPDFAELRDSAVLQESINTTGAVVMGRRAYAMGDPDSYADQYEYQVPIFVLTHEIPLRRPRQTDRLTFTFVTDGIESAIQQAKTAAGDRDVTIVGGARTIQQCLKARLADELHIDIMPVLLCSGLRLFENIGTEPLNLERLSVTELPGGRTQFRFRVVR